VVRRRTGQAILLSIAILAVIVDTVLIAVLPTPRALPALGWVFFAIGAVLIAVSIATLRSKGTTAVIDSGIYGIVRHPLYLGGMSFYLGHFFFCPHWIVGLVVAVSLAAVYGIMVLEEESLAEKFGSTYKRYRETVPRANALLGIVRLLHRRRG